MPRTGGEQFAAPPPPAAPGSTLAGVVVLRQVTSIGDGRRYRVRHACCGWEHVVPHYHLRAVARRGVPLPCALCAHRGSDRRLRALVALVAGRRAGVQPMRAESVGRLLGLPWWQQADTALVWLARHGLAAHLPGGELAPTLAGITLVEALVG